MNLVVAAAALAVLSRLATSQSVDMGTCRMVCDVSTSHGQTGNPLIEAPGKKGPPGSKREKRSAGSRGDKRRARRAHEGEPATPCLCPEQETLQLQIIELQRQIQRVNAPQDCRDVLPRKDSFRGGVYTIYPYETNERGEEVYCDTQTDDGGWIVFQRRVDGSEDFFRGWSDYVNGFGDLNGEFWLGLDKIYNIMKTGRYELRVDLEDFENNSAYAKYSTFELGGPDEFYPITTSGYSGTAGNSLALTSVAFSTKDQDHDTFSTGSCANGYKGAMWYTACHYSNLNGLYLRGATEIYAQGVVWRTWKEYYYSLKFSEMKMRRKE